MADRSGQQLGNYRVISQIGRGGFAEVYLGEHIYLKTKVAIKLLRTTVANPTDLDDFLKEAQTIAGLVHPNIVRVMDFGVDGETPYLVMDYAPNGTLRQRHSKGIPLPVTTIIPYVKQVAAALQHAHNEKLVHRDVKPENMLVGRNNEVLLSDFGIALIAQSSRYQSTQDVTGTIAYMSPEQIQGKPRPASDQYSLGIVVFEWLSGEQPFRGSFTELCAQHVMAPPPALHEKVPGIAPDVEKVVMTTLAKDPHLRFGSVQAFATALEQASQAPRPTPVPSPPPPVQAQPAPLPPTQYAARSPVPPTQIAGGPSLQEMRLSATADVRPASSLSSGKVNAWGIGKRQLVATGIGLIIYGICNYVLDIVFNSAAYASFFNPLIGGSPYSPSLATILLGLTLVVVWFFSAEFGPWVGLVVALVGSLLTDTLSGALANFHFYWYVYASYAILGFFPGLALLGTQDPYKTARATVIAIVMTVIGIILGSIFTSVGDGLVYGNSFLPEFFSFTFSFLIALILLPVLLVIYDRIANRGKSVSTTP
jgi:serine/threonine protein kinase/uncharacterized membrane protein